MLSNSRPRRYRHSTSRDGGFSGTGAALSLSIVGAELARKSPPQRRALLAYLLVAAGAWAGGAIMASNDGPAKAMVPRVELRRLDDSAVQLTTLTGKPLVVNL